MSEFDAENARIEDSKISDYLLAVDHRVGSAKARFFMRHGFSPDHREEFGQALRDHAIGNPVVEHIETQYGKKWVVEGPLACPDGTGPVARSVWILDSGGDFPRLVTAYPVD